MIGPVFKSNNNLNNPNQQSFSQSHHKKQDKKSDDIDMFPTAEVMRINKEKKLQEQIKIGAKLRQFEKERNYTAIAYLKWDFDRDFHMVNINIPNDIIVREPPKNIVDILA